jgi:transposase
MVNSRRKYDREFKLETVRLITDGGRGVAEVARSLGIHENLLYYWRRKYLDDTVHAFPGKGHLKPADEELRRLKKELTDVKEERDILKKALAIISKHNQNSCKEFLLGLFPSLICNGNIFRICKLGKVEEALLPFTP